MTNKKVTYYFDKDDGFTLSRENRKFENRIAFGEIGVIVKFMEMLMSTLKALKDGSTLEITATIKD